MSIARSLALAAAVACGGSPASEPSLRSIRLTALPAGEDDLAAAQLGFQLFYDARLSSNQELRCASCHMPERAFSDGKAVSQGRALLDRNAPTLLNAARMSPLMWDGSAKTLAEQALLPLERENEMDFTRLELAHRIEKSFRSRYEGAFGPLPDFADAARFPARGKPGDAVWAAMAPADRDAVDAVAANVGKAFEAYQRKLAAGDSRVDRFLDGDGTALDSKEQLGLRVLAREGCLACHSGQMLSDGALHDVGTNGPFRTPSLRNLNRTAPYGHDGRFAGLEDVLSAHGAGGSLPAADRDALLAALRALDGSPPAAPWNNWPQN